MTKLAASEPFAMTQSSQQQRLTARTIRGSNRLMAF